MENKDPEIFFDSTQGRHHRNNQNNQQVWQEELPNSNTVLALGIISIATSLWLGLIGLVLGIIALVLASKANKLYLDNPSQYTLASHSNMKAGKICAIVGVCLSTVHLLIVASYIAFIAAFLTHLS